MALGVNTIFDVRTTGSDTANGGAFDPGQTAGMLTDGAATSATGNSPVFTSASYNFVAGDVGAWIYISSGTNWTPGWYQIASVASNAATLTATIGAAYLAVNKIPTAITTAAGCATTASPTGATWTIDYSQQNSAQFSYTDLASVGTGLTVSSVANPFNKQQVGNALIIASGTNFNAGVYVIASVAANVATLVGAGNITTGAGVTGVGGLGGAFATPGKVGGVKVASNLTFIKSGTYTLSNTTANTSGGPISDTTGGAATIATWWVGWNTVRILHNTDSTIPTISAGSQTSITIFNTTVTGIGVVNIIVDGNSGTSTKGFAASALCEYYRCSANNCTNNGFINTGGVFVSYYYCKATGNGGTATTQYAFNLGILSHCFGCEAYGNTVGGFGVGGTSGCILIDCIASGNTGASSDGFVVGSTSRFFHAYNCVSYGNGRAGFEISASGANQCSLLNCIAEGNTGAGFSTSAVCPAISLFNCGAYNNSGGTYSTTNITNTPNFITNTTGSFFTNAASGDFSLNNTANQGALARATGFPGLMPRGLTTSYLDIGAAQHQDAGGSSGISNRLYSFQNQGSR